MELRPCAFAAHGTKAAMPEFGPISEDVGKAGDVAESVRYRQYAANCVRAAQEAANQTTRLSLLDMAQAWLMLADVSEHAARTIESAAAQDGTILIQINRNGT